MALLEVTDLHVRYEPKRGAAVDAVTDISFAIEPGEFVGLIGESGSGKTTLGTALLRLLERPGRIAGGPRPKLCSTSVPIPRPVRSPTLSYCRSLLPSNS